MASYRLGIDIGGTFTDATLIDEETGELQIAKVLSTPADPSRGFMEAATRIVGGDSKHPRDVRILVHATTVATNSIIEGKTAKTGLITTDGFRDILEIGRQMRPALYDIHFQKPPPVVPRYLSFGIPGRLSAQGDVLIDLDEEALRRAVSALRDEGVQSIAVCFLHSYLNPAHEQAAAEIIRELYPEALVSLSSEVAPEFREYLRTSTTVINAAIRPVVADYLERIETRLQRAEFKCQLLVMQSNGGVYSSAAARPNPVFMVESGPAAGVIAAAYLGESIGVTNMLSLDMGGTTAKAGVIIGGVPDITKEYEVGAAAKTGVGGKQRGSGYPILTPVIDLVEIGAGGGSIAWIDSGGALRVGPQSAGADPGPASYGKGGANPTVTDANLVLGRLNSDYFLGGEMTLDVEAARAAIEAKCATPLQLGIADAANAIVEIANAAMVNALRLVSIQRGYDPREFVLVAFGGAGPMHANRLAAEMDIDTVVVPVRPGVFSSVGLLVTDIKRDYSMTFLAPAAEAAFTELHDSFAELEERGRQHLLTEGLAEETLSFVRLIDVRYVGQSYELTIQVPSGELDSAYFGTILEEFHREHDRAYGFNAPDEPVEFVAVRLSALGSVSKPRLQEISVQADGTVPTKNERSVYFPEVNGNVKVGVYDRYRLGAGAVIEGPAIVEEIESSTVIHPGYNARTDALGNLWIRKA